MPETICKCQSNLVYICQQHIFTHLSSTSIKHEFEILTEELQEIDYNLICYNLKESINVLNQLELWVIDTAHKLCTYITNIASNNLKKVKERKAAIIKEIDLAVNSKKKYKKVNAISLELIPFEKITGNLELYQNLKEIIKEKTEFTEENMFRSFEYKGKSVFSYKAGPKITPLYYKKDTTWCWSPYDPSENNQIEWIKCPDLVVQTGSYKGEKPAYINQKLIIWLSKVNPTPRLV